MAKFTAGHMKQVAEVLHEVHQEVLMEGDDWDDLVTKFVSMFSKSNNKFNAHKFREECRHGSDNGLHV